jgi:hypothetical protein
MRTTLVIDDHVLREAKRLAAESGMTLSDLTTLALREAVRQRELPARRAKFSFPTYGSGRRRDSSPAAIAEFRDEGR